MHPIRPLVEKMLFGIATGVVVGLAQVLFFEGMERIFAFRAGRETSLFFLLPFLGIVIVYLFQRFDTQKKFGMDLLFKVDQEKEKDIPLVMAPVMVVTTWLSHLGGGSVGREGVAVQVGSTLSKWIQRRTSFSISDSVALTSGVAAGFAGLFGTPFAAGFFAMALFCGGALRLSVCLPVFCSSFTSAGIAYLFGLRKSVFVVDGNYSFSFSFLIKLLILGICFALAGVLFSKGMHWAKHAYKSRIANPYIRIVVGATIVMILMLATNGRYAGLGEQLIRDAIGGNEILPWDFLGKMALTILTLSCGFQGGEVMPLFAIGATLGAALSSWLGLPQPLCAAIGYCAVFAAGTNTYFAALCICLEAFGPSLFIPVLIAVSLSYSINRNQSIYPLQEQNSPFDSIKHFVKRND